METIDDDFGIQKYLPNQSHVGIIHINRYSFYTFSFRKTKTIKIVFSKQINNDLEQYQ